MTPLRVLIAGGGVAGLETALALRHLAGERVAVELLAPAGEFVDRTRSVRTPFAGPAAPRMPLEGLAGLGVKILPDAAAAVDSDRRELRTTDGRVLGYDRLVVALGARGAESLPGAVHFHGPRSAGAVERALRDAPDDDDDRPLTFAVTEHVSWPLPLYELAFAAAQQQGAPPVRLVTPEAAPLELLGPRAADAVARLLDRAGVEVLTRAAPREFVGGSLLLAGAGLRTAGGVVALPAPVGRPLGGLPHDARGFLRVDAYGRVGDVPGVYAAGDTTAGTVKQGGLAAQQADAVAAHIAADAGARIEATPQAPVLRAVLFAGRWTVHVRTPLDRPEAGVVSAHRLWRPPGKIAARHLSGYLATGEPDDVLEDLPVQHAAGSAA